MTTVDQTRLFPTPEKASIRATTKPMTDRFSEGHLAAMFEAGHIAMILRRMAIIRDSVPK